MRRRRHALGVEDVIQPDRNDVKRSFGPIAHDRRFHVARLGERWRCGKMQKAMESRIETRDAIETILCQLDRREFFRGDERGSFGDGWKFGTHDAAFLSKVKMVAGSLLSARFWRNRSVRLSIVP